MIDKEKIGHVFNVTAANGCNLNILIEDNPLKFSFYRKMELDVFTKKPVIKVKAVKVETEEVKTILPIESLEAMRAAELKVYAKENGIKGNTKKDILNAIREGNK